MHHSVQRLSRENVPSSRHGPGYTAYNFISTSRYYRVIGVVFLSYWPYGTLPLGNNKRKLSR